MVPISLLAAIKATRAFLLEATADFSWSKSIFLRRSTGQNLDLDPRGSSKLPAWGEYSLVLRRAGNNFLPVPVLEADEPLDSGVQAFCSTAGEEHRSRSAGNEAC